MSAADGGRSWFRPSLVVAALVFVVALTLVFLVGRRDAPQKFHGQVNDLLPAGVPGWDITNAPIAETPEIQRQVDELLNFDDAVYRIYEKNGFRISVYLAYWRPGKMQTKDIGRHTPDSCWVLAGWKRVEMATLPGLPMRDGARTGLTEHRKFEANGKIEHVVFWHVVEEAAHSYRTGGRPPWHWLISDSLRRGLNQKPEQFFLRISSNRPLNEIWDADIVQQVVGRIPGIRQPAP